MSLRWHLGTMGYGYRDWQNGVFYPAGLPARAQLSHYSQVFDAVEMDTTFYGIPPLARVQRWAAAVPAGFTFCPKTPREITHELRLKQAVTLMEAFIGAVRHFGAALGPLLIQLPPDMTSAARPDLAAFLSALPEDVRYAVEFRHRSWHATATGELLQKHNVCWVSAEYLYLPQRVYKTTDFLYIRWLGRHGTYEQKTHERVDRSDRLRAWHDDIMARSTGVDRVYGFFNNDYSGFSPATCNRFKTIAGLPTAAANPPEQPRLL